MDEIIRIQCPNDGAILNIKNQLGIENKKVVCPVCKLARPFSEYKKYVPSQMEDTDYHNNKQSGEVTSLDESNELLGRVCVIGTNQKMQLKPGNTIIGRSSATSHVDFPVNTGESRRMSREHLLIEVVKKPGKGYVHQVRLCKEKCNPTYINQVKLEYGDCIVLHTGDVLRLPDANLKFEIPDDDLTEF